MLRASFGGNILSHYVLLYVHVTGKEHRNVNIVRTILYLWTHVTTHFVNTIEYLWGEEIIVTVDK